MTFIPTREFLIEVEKGVVPGHSIVDLFAENGDVDTGSVPEDLWANGGVRTEITTAAVVSVVSASANDAAGLSGVDQIFIRYLDSSYVLTEETLTLTGTTPVTSASTAIRFLYGELRKNTATGDENAGNITISIGGNTLGFIPTGDDTENATQLSHYTIPDGKTGYLLRFYMNSKRNDSTVVAVQWKQEDQLWQTFRQLEANEAHVAVDLEGAAGLVLPEHTDIRMQAVSTLNNNSVVRGGYALLLVDD